MRRIHLILTVAVIASLLITVLPASAGSGAPSGQHYSLNIIGVDNPKNPPMDDTSRHTIFVPLWGKCNIGLTAAPDDGSIDLKDFQVLDGNCFDGDGTVIPDSTLVPNNLDAAFMLPKPDPDLDGYLNYSVWVKVTSPKGEAKMSTCYYDASLGETYCYTGLTLTLNKANYPKFTNVSKNLLSVCVNTGTLLDPNFQVKPLFWDAGDTYWWEYDNSGLRKAMFRFYPGVPDTGAYGLNSPCSATAR